MNSERKQLKQSLRSKVNSLSEETLSLQILIKIRPTRPLTQGLLKLKVRFLVFVLLLGILWVSLVWDLLVAVVGNQNSKKRFDVLANS